MTPKQQNIAIAKVCGWEFPSSLVESTRGWYGIPPRKHKEMAEEPTRIPYYTEDLNLMHEAEKTLTSEQFMDYNGHVGCSREYGDWWNKNLSHASPSVRAKAFLRILDLWDSEQ